MNDLTEGQADAGTGLCSLEQGVLPGASSAVESECNPIVDLPSVYKFARQLLIGCATAREISAASAPRNGDADAPFPRAGGKAFGADGNELRRSGTEG